MDVLDAIESAGGEKLPSQPQLLILRHALREFARSGYAGTNVRQIGQAAGLSASLVNYHFGSKEALYRQLAEAVLNGLARAATTSAEKGDLKEQVMGILLGHLAFAEQHPHAFAFIMDLVYGSRAGRPTVPLESLYAGVSDLLRVSVTAAVASRQIVLRPGTEETTLLNALDAVLGWAVHRAFKGDKPSEAQMADILDLTLAGVRA